MIINVVLIMLFGHLIGGCLPGAQLAPTWRVHSAGIMSAFGHLIGCLPSFPGAPNCQYTTSIRPVDHRYTGPPGLDPGRPAHTLFFDLPGRILDFPVGSFESISKFSSQLKKRWLEKNLLECGRAGKF